MTHNRVWLGYGWETLRTQWSPWVQASVLRHSPSQFGLLFLSIHASSGTSSRADPSQSCGQGCSHGAVLGLGLWGLVEDVGPPSSPQPPSLSIASPVPPCPLDSQGSGLPEPPLSLTVDAPSVPPQ